MTEPLELAVTAWRLDATTNAGDLTAQALMAESLGYHSFWLPESHFAGNLAVPSPLMILAAVAATTSRIRLGSTSYLLPIRHPLHAAEEVAVLDRLSDGRVILGVGRGVQDVMFQAFAVDRHDKRKRFKANLESMIKAWRGESVVAGDKVVTLAPLPLQQPHPPIWVAAFGPLAIRQAGRLGLPYLASPVETLAQLADNYRRHGAFAAEAGHTAIDVVPVMRTLYISDEPARLARVKTTLEQSTPPSMRDESARLDDWAIVGTSQQVADKIARYRETLGMTHLIVRGRIPGVEETDWIQSLARLGEVSG